MAAALIMAMAGCGNSNTDPNQQDPADSAETPTEQEEQSTAPPAAETPPLVEEEPPIALNIPSALPCDGESGTLSDDADTSMRHRNGWVGGMSDGWIYMRDYHPDRGPQIVKVHTATCEEAYFDVAGVRNMGWLVVQGEWIYFLQHELTGIEPGLYRIRTDGTSLEHISGCFIHTCIDVNLYVVDDWAYFTERDKRVFRVQLDGSGDAELLGSEMLHFSIHEGWIYYFAPGEGQFPPDGTIGRMRLDGTENTEVLYIEVAARWLLAYGEHLYFIDVNHRLHRMRLDGVGGVQTYEVRIPWQSSDFIVTDEWLYFVNANSDNRIYKMRLDGTEIQLFHDASPVAMGMEDGWLFYRLGAQSNYMLRLDGTGHRAINPQN